MMEGEEATLEEVESAMGPVASWRRKPGLLREAWRSIVSGTRAIRMGGARTKLQDDLDTCRKWALTPEELDQLLQVF